MIVSTPGRICLFGEHQDYLGLPVIAAAISKRIQIQGSPRNDRQVRMNLPDVGGQEHFDLDFPLSYEKSRDYMKSVCNVLARKGHSFPHGFDLEVRGNIPINSGTSSSSALIVAWVTFLSEFFQWGYTQQEIGEITYAAEVLEFTEPGGMMDQYATAVGNVIYLESEPSIAITTYQQPMGNFVLGDSLQAKDTLGILSRVKFGTQAGFKKLQELEPTLTWHQAQWEDIQSMSKALSEDEITLIRANLSDRDLLRQAKAMFEGKLSWSDAQLGAWLQAHQENLREHKRISTPKIDAMIAASMQAGALGAKINGSGGGGCMFAYAPEGAEEVAAAIEAQGGKAYIIQVDSGTRREQTSMF